MTKLYGPDFLGRVLPIPERSSAEPKDILSRGDLIVTDEERAAKLQEVAEAFLMDADAKYQGTTNEELTIQMLGTVAGAAAVMLASGLPFANVFTSINQILSDMGS